MPKRDASPESAYDSADEIDNNLTTSVKSSSKSSKSKTYTSASKTKARERVEPESESDEEATEKPQSHSEEGSGSGDEDEEEFEIESIEDAKIGAIDEVRHSLHYIALSRTAYRHSNLLLTRLDIYNVILSWRL